MKHNTLMTCYLLGTQHKENTHYPEDWQAYLAPLPEAQRATVALALLSHELALTTIPTPSTTLDVYPCLPRLPNLCLEPSLLPHIDHALEQCRKVNTHFACLAELLINKLTDSGYSLHPNQYRKLYRALGQRIPTAYQAWDTWLAKPDTDYHDAINADNWVEFTPRSRLLALQSLRLHHAQACRELISHCIAQENAKHRLEILALLEETLTPADRPLLEQLSQDKSQKVASQAQRYLNILGYIQPATLTDEEQQLLKETYQLKKSILNLSSKKLSIMTKKFEGKHQALLGKIDLATFAHILGIDLSDLLKGWSFARNHNHPLDNAYLLQSARQLEPALQTDLMDNLKSCRQPELELETLAQYRRYLSTNQQHELILHYLQHDRFWDFVGLSQITATPLSLQQVDWTTLKRSKIWRTLLNATEDQEADCLALGLLIPNQLASFALNELKNSPQTALATLRLSAYLNTLGELT